MIRSLSVCSLVCGLLSAGCFIVPGPAGVHQPGGAAPTASMESSAPAPASFDVAAGEPVRLEIRVRLPERFRARFVEKWSELRMAAALEPDFIGTSLAETVTTDPVPELVAALDWSGLESLRGFARSDAFVRVAKELPGTPEVVLRRVLTDRGERITLPAADSVEPELESP